MRVDLRSIAQAATMDPKQALLERVGDLIDYEIFHNLVLVATHIPSEKTAGGIIKPDRSLQEDRFQGKVGLVLKYGPMAFVDDNVARFGGITVEPGDWVVFRTSDAMEFFIKDRKGRDGDGVSCRLIEDTMIKGRVTDPALVY